MMTREQFKKRAAEIWNEPPELTEFRVGGAQLPAIVKTPDPQHGERQFALEFATIGQWCAGIGFVGGREWPQCHGHEIGRLLLERAGGDLAARIIDHVDPPREPSA